MSCFWINYVWWFVFSLKLHLFHEDNIIKNLWNDLALFFENDFSLFDLTMQAAFVGFLNADLKLIFIQNHLLLLSKIYIYNTRRSESLILKSLIREVMKVKTIKRKISIKSKKKKITICTQKNGSKLKLFWRTKQLSILSNFFL